MVEMQLTAVRVDLHDNTPMVFLREVGGARRTLPILIAHPEATAIELAIRGIQPQRPLTHDLFRDVLAALGVTVDHIVVTELRDRTFYAELHLTQGERRFTISCRPSDAIALAARVGCTIYADEDLLDIAGVEVVDDEDEEEGEEDDELVEQFREFIEDIRPEDFTS